MFIAHKIVSYLAANSKDWSAKDKKQSIGRCPMIFYVHFRLRQTDRNEPIIFKKFG